MTIYLIRHAQSEFNAVFDPEKPDPMIFDAPITELGRSQAEAARKNVADLPISQIIVSPLTRTLQTAAIMFENALPTSINAVVREQLKHSCDVGTHPEKLARDHSHLDFSHLDDVWWHDGEKNHLGYAVESRAVLEERAAEFVAFAKQTQIRSTAIVTHGNFIHAVTGIQPENCQIVEFRV